MSHPTDLKYTKDHEWIRVEGDVGTVGITHHAQAALGDVVFVDLPAAGTSLRQGAQFGTVESVKAVSELYAPLSGQVVDVNALLQDQPQLVNTAPHADGWMIRIRIADRTELDNLLDAAAYERVVGS